jgi:hypothetical protein
MLDIDKKDKMYFLFPFLKIEIKRPEIQKKTNTKGC